MNDSIPQANAVRPGESSPHLTYHLTQADIAATFAEWERRWRTEHEPSGDAELAAMTPEVRGARGAAHFLSIAADLGLGETP